MNPEDLAIDAWRDECRRLREERNEAIELLRWYYNYEGDNGDGDFDERVGPFLADIDKEES